MEISQAVQNISPQQLQALMQSQTGIAALQAGEEGGGFFALLLQMLEGMSQPEDAAALFPMLAGGPLSDEEEKKGSELAMQLLAGMLDPGALGLVQQAQNDLSQENSQLVQLIGSFAGVDSQKAQQLYLLMQAADDSQTARPAAEEKPQAGQEALQGGKGFLEVLDFSLNTSKTQENGQSSLQFGGSFRQAVAEAQKLMSEKPQQDDKEQKLDVESLQSLADTRREQIQQARFSAAREDISQPQPLTEQIRTGIREGLLQGKSEFVVRLKPEGLGEITVRLTEGTDGSMTLNLTASTAQTAKLLNQELTGLREALRPYGTEVTPAVSQPQESAYADGGYTGAQFDAHHGQQASYGQQHGQNGQPSHFGDFVYEEEDADTEMAELYGPGGLHAYI
ncbi:MAG: hypothetical protein HFG27_01340 [Provencibacterium sp.]|jgi:flagellar hook-length control protein FliK|nr:hypothetical protein [Provencibacterium sp.]